MLKTLSVLNMSLVRAMALGSSSVLQLQRLTMKMMTMVMMQV